MTIILDPYTIPEKGLVELNVKRLFEIKVTAAEARRKVDRWLLNEVSHLMGAEAPTLVVGERVIWRVPAWISFPHVGRAGVVGTVDVDVTTGEMTNTPARKADIERQAEAVAARQPPYRPRETPEKYLAKNVSPIPKLHILDDGTLAVISSSEKE